MMAKASFSLARIQGARSFFSVTPYTFTITRPSVYINGPQHVMKDGRAKRSFGSYIENYYTTNHAATGFSTPLRKTFAFMIFVFQAVFTFGYLFHTNYYFTGKALPKPEQAAQLCSDSK